MAFSIGPISIEDPVFLAPMTGVTDEPFRRLVRRFGAGLVFSEMIASRCMIENSAARKRREPTIAMNTRWLCNWRGAIPISWPRPRA